MLNSQILIHVLLQQILLFLLNFLQLRLECLDRLLQVLLLLFQFLLGLFCLFALLLGSLYQYVDILHDLILGGLSLDLLVLLIRYQILLVDLLLELSDLRLQLHILSLNLH